MLDFNLGDFYPTERSGNPTGTGSAALRGPASPATGLAYWLRILTRRPLRPGQRLGSSAA